MTVKVTLRLPSPPEVVIEHLTVGGGEVLNCGYLTIEDARQLRDALDEALAAWDENKDRDWQSIVGARE